MPTKIPKIGNLKSFTKSCAIVVEGDLKFAKKAFNYLKNKGFDSYLDVPRLNIYSLQINYYGDMYISWSEDKSWTHANIETIFTQENWKEFKQFIKNNYNPHKSKWKKVKWPDSYFL